MPNAQLFEMPKTESTMQTIWVTSKFLKQTHYLIYNFRASRRSKLPKTFDHRMNSAWKDLSLVYSYSSLCDTVTYRGHAYCINETQKNKVHYMHKLSGHARTRKFNTEKEEAVPLLFTDNEEDTALVEAISVVTRKFLANFNF